MSENRTGQLPFAAAAAALRKHTASPTPGEENIPPKHSSRPSSALSWQSGTKNGLGPQRAASKRPGINDAQPTPTLRQMPPDKRRSSYGAHDLAVPLTFRQGRSSGRTSPFARIERSISRAGTMSPIPTNHAPAPARRRWSSSSYDTHRHAGMAKGGDKTHQTNGYKDNSNNYGIPPRRTSFGGQKTPAPNAKIVWDPERQTLVMKKPEVRPDQDRQSTYDNGFFRDHSEDQNQSSRYMPNPPRRQSGPVSRSMSLQHPAPAPWQHRRHASLCVRRPSPVMESQEDILEGKPAKEHEPRRQSKGHQPAMHSSYAHGNGEAKHDRPLRSSISEGNIKGRQYGRERAETSRPTTPRLSTLHTQAIRSPAKPALKLSSSRPTSPHGSRNSRHGAVLKDDSNSVHDSRLESLGKPRVSFERGVGAVLKDDMPMQSHGTNELQASPKDEGAPEPYNRHRPTSFRNDEAYQDVLKPRPDLPSFDSVRTGSSSRSGSRTSSPPTSARASVKEAVRQEEKPSTQPVDSPPKEEAISGNEKALGSTNEEGGPAEPDMQVVPAPAESKALVQTSQEPPKANESALPALDTEKLLEGPQADDGELNSSPSVSSRSGKSIYIDALESWSDEEEAERLRSADPSAFVDPAMQGRLDEMRKEQEGELAKLTGPLSQPVLQHSTSEGPAENRDRDARLNAADGAPAKMQREADVPVSAGTHEPAPKSRKTNTESEQGDPNTLQSTNETSELLPAPLRPKKSAKRLTSQMLAGKEQGNRREPTRAPAPKLVTRNGKAGVRKTEPRLEASSPQRQGSKKAPSSAGRTAAAQRKPWRHDVAMPEDEMESFAPQTGFAPADARRSHAQPSNNGATAVRRSSHVSLDGSTTHPLSGLYSSGSLANASTSSFKKRKRKPSGRGGFTGAKNPSVPSRTPEPAAAPRPSPGSLAERNASTRRTHRLSKGADSTYGQQPQPVFSRQSEKPMASMSSPPEASNTMSRMTMRTGGGSTRASKPRRRFSDSSSDEAGPLATSSLVSNLRGSGNRLKPRRNLQDSSDEDDIALPSTTRNKPFSAAPRGAHNIYSNPSDSAVSIGLVSALDYPNRNANGSRLASKQALDVPEQENRKRGLFRIFSKSKRPSGDRASTPVPAATEDSVEKTKPQTLRRESNNASPSSDATVIRSPRKANPLGRNQESFTNNTHLSPLASSANVASGGNAASGPAADGNLSHAGSAISPQATHDDRHSLPSASETPRRGSRTQSANQQSSPHSPQSKIMPPQKMNSSVNAEVAPSPPSIATGGGSPPPLAKSGTKRKPSFWRRLFRSGSS